MNAYEATGKELIQSPRLWLVTGCAGFIGSNLVEGLLRLEQRVVGLDNFSTGYRENLDEVRESVGEDKWRRFSLLEEDIRSLEACRAACQGVDVVLHQAALGSVPISVEDPVFAHENNLSGFLNMLVAAREAGVGRFVYASSSAVYGDSVETPQREGSLGECLSPYALTKLADEMYAGVFAKVYGYKSVGLRYFNIFGPRQDPEGAYAAVIPQWFSDLIHGRGAYINGDGETTRDFCHVDNCVQANILAATAPEEALDEAYNIGNGVRTSLNELFGYIREVVRESCPSAAGVEPEYREFRPGDVRHSLADIGKARKLLGYEPVIGVREGLLRAGSWYVGKLRSPAEQGKAAKIRND